MAVDRVGRESESSRGHYLTIAIAFQPAALTKLAKIPNARNFGLLSRFLFCIPKGLTGTRTGLPKAIPEQTKGNWAALLYRLAEMDTSIIRMSSEARELMYAWKDEIELRLAPKGDMARIADWGGKLERGQLARIAGILHCCEQLSPATAPMSVATIRRAIKLCHYYIEHAKRAFRQMESPLADDAAKLLKYLNKTNKAAGFTLLDAYGPQRWTAEHGREVLKELEKLGYVALVDKKKWEVIAPYCAETIEPEPMVAFEPAPEPAAGGIE